MPENNLNGNDVINNDDSHSKPEDELRKLFYEIRRSRRSSDCCFLDDDDDDDDDDDLLDQFLSNKGWSFLDSPCFFIQTLFRYKKEPSFEGSKLGSDEWIRTADRSGMNRLLQPTELRRHKFDKVYYTRNNSPCQLYY